MTNTGLQGAEIPRRRVALLPHAKVSGAVISPQPGPQTLLLESPADIAIIGGGAYGGKTFSLLLVDVRNIDSPKWSSVTFRRDTNQIRNPGGLWDEAVGLYKSLGGKPVSGPLEITFPSGALSKFWHLEHATDVYAWDGAQIPCLKFDQLEHFEESQFWYMLSRNRDPSGTIRPYCRATCNPSPDSWLRRLLDWWIDPKTGYAIPERSGKLRWFVRIEEDLHWANSREELWAEFRKPELPDEHPEQIRPRSITFIIARIWDNKEGLAKDPGYVGNLMLLPKHERERLLGDANLGGNWNVRPSSGMFFQRGWCNNGTGVMLKEEPSDVEWVRAWDLGATKPSAANPDPDWTVGVKIGRYRGKRRFVISKVHRMRDNPGKVREKVEGTAQADGPEIVIAIPQDPGQAGKAQVDDYVKALAGYTVRYRTMSGDKIVRFSPFSVQAEHGNVDIVEGVPEEYLRRLESFPEGHDDDADATSEGFFRLAGVITGDQVLDYFKSIGAGIKVPTAQERAAKRAEEAAKAAVPQMSTTAVVPGDSSIAEAAQRLLSSKSTTPVPDLSVHTEPYKAFMFGAGRRYTANEKGLIIAENEIDLQVLLKAGCSRHVTPPTPTPEQPG